MREQPRSYPRIGPHRLAGDGSLDWVVIYLDGGREEGQWTVITARRGTLAGRRIVRGREAECAGHCGLDSPDPAEATAASSAPAGY